MLDAHWEGYLLDESELKVLFALAGQHTLPGFDLNRLSDTEVDQATDALLKAGFLWLQSEQIGVESVMRFLMEELGNYAACLLMRTAWSSLRLYRTPSLWICLEQQHGPWRVLPLETEAEAYDIACDFADVAQGHVSAMVVTPTNPGVAVRLGEHWIQTLYSLWTSIGNSTNLMQGGAS